MNRVNIAWVEPEKRRLILETMVRNGVGLVRLSLTPPVAASIDAVRIAHELGMAILLEIPLSYAHFYPAGVQKRLGHGRVWDIYPLSMIDPKRVRRVVRRSLIRLDSLGVSLAAVEPGNEINWAGYNGDLHVRVTAGAPMSWVTGGLHSRTAFEAGLTNYVALVQMIKEELSAIRRFRRTKLVSAGLAHMPMRFAARMGAEYVSPNETAALLRSRGIERFIDAYGTHFYASARTEGRLARINDALRLCLTPADGKPCWVTEWGIANPSKACPLDDRDRTQTMAEIRTLLERRMATRSISAAFYFDWDKSETYSVWRCGELSEAGKLAVKAR